MTISQMRTQVANAYDSFRWRDKVARMSDGQVTAIYFSFLKNGKFEKKKTTKIPGEKIHQMTLFECGLKGAYIHEQR